MSILETFARKAVQLEVIILSPEMCQNSQQSQGRNPRTQLKGERGDWGEESGRGGKLT